MFRFINIFLIFLILIIVTAVSLIFLAHHDKLAKYVPADSSLYIHTYPQNINKLEIQHQSTVYSLLNNLGLSNQQAQKVIELAKKEIAFYKQPYSDFQIITFVDQDLINFLQQNNISFVQQDKVIYFPKINNNLSYQTENSLTDLAQFRNKNINFSLAYFYFSGKEPLFLPNFVQKESIEPFLGYIYLKNNNIIAKTNLPMKLTSTYNKNINYILQNQIENCDLYTKNIDYSTLSVNKVSKIPENIKYAILKDVGETVEFLDFNQEKFAFTTYYSKQTLQLLQQSIINEIAMLLPEEQKKTLPDDTIAVNLVANPDLWSFTQTDNSNYYLKVEKLNLDINITIQHNLILVTNNYQINDLFENNSTNSQPLNQCSNYNYLITINNPLGNNLLKSISFAANNQQNTIICIQ